MSDLSHSEIRELVSCALSISGTELDARDPAAVREELEATLKQRQSEYDQAQGRINKRLAKGRLDQAQTARDAAIQWEKRKELVAILDEVMELADKGSFFRATDLLQRREESFMTSGDTHLIQRFRKVQSLIQGTLRPNQMPPDEVQPPAPSSEQQAEGESETAPLAREEAPPPAPAQPPRAHKAPEPAPPPPPAEPELASPEAEIVFEELSFGDHFARTTIGPPPKCSRFTYSLGDRGRLHVCHSSAPVTMGRYNNPHNPNYPLLAVVQKDKSETSRLLRMLSGRHGSLVFSQGQWGISDTWPADHNRSTNGIFVDGARVEHPASFQSLDEKTLTFANPDPKGAVPRFRIRVLRKFESDSLQAVFLERLDACKDHILLMHTSAEVPPEFGGASFKRVGDGFVHGPEDKPITAETPDVLAFNRLEVTPLEHAFYGREV